MYNLFSDLVFKQLDRDQSFKYLRVRNKKYFSYFSTKTYVVGTQKNRLIETGSVEHPKFMFKLMGKKYLQLSAKYLVYLNYDWDPANVNA